MALPHAQSPQVAPSVAGRAAMQEMRCANRSVRQDVIRLDQIDAGRLDDALAQ
jgi:hypothetical protein